MKTKMGLHPMQADLGAKFLLVNDAGGDFVAYPPNKKQIEDAYQEVIQDGDYRNDMDYLMEALSDQDHEMHEDFIEELRGEVPFILSM
jgi:hypothetical protein